MVHIFSITSCRILNFSIVLAPSSSVTAPGARRVMHAYARMAAGGRVHGMDLIHSTAVYAVFIPHDCCSCVHPLWQYQLNIYIEILYSYLELTSALPTTVAKRQLKQQQLLCYIWFHNTIRVY
eukprot:SAG31_NODE_178_length_21247_cov_11.492009_6_plen_123_part_00